MRLLIHKIKEILPHFKIDTPFLIKAFLFEMAVIILAILVAFEFGIYRQSLKEESFRDSSYSLLVQDVDNNIKFIREAIEFLNNSSELYSKITKDFKETNKINFGDFFNYYNTHVVIPSHRYYENLTASGKLQHLESDLLASKYSRLYYLNSLINYSYNVLEKEFLLMLEVFAYKSISIADGTFNDNVDFSLLHNIISAHIVSRNRLKKRFVEYIDTLEEIKIIVQGLGS